VTFFRTLDAALAYHAAVPGTQLLVRVGATYRKALKRHADELMQQRVKAAVRAQISAVREVERRHAA
jgi:hypothetical protein